MSLRSRFHPDGTDRLAVLASRTRGTVVTAPFTFGAIEWMLQTFYVLGATGIFHTSHLGTWTRIIRTALGFGQYLER